MNRLKDLRENKQLHQRHIAEYLQMSQTGYSQYETETNDVPIEKLKKLADFYHTSIDYILCMTDEKKPYAKSKLNKGKK